MRKPWWVLVLQFFGFPPQTRLVLAPPDFTTPDDSNDPVTFPLTFTVAGTYTDSTQNQGATVLCEFDNCVPGVAATVTVPTGMGTDPNTGTWQATLTVTAQNSQALTATLTLPGNPPTSSCTSRINVTTSNAPPVTVGGDGYGSAAGTYTPSGTVQAGYLVEGDILECRLSTGHKQEDIVVSTKDGGVVLDAGKVKWTATFKTLPAKHGHYVVVIRVLRNNKVVAAASTGHVF
jgi:hypothetical protein